MSDEKGQDDALEVSLIDSIAKGELKGLAGDAVEIAIDAVLDDNLLQAIPVVGTIGRLYRTGVSIRDRLFLRKVLSFLNELSDVRESDRKRFAEELGKDAGSRSRAGAALVLLLERLDDLEKAEVIGRLYRARLEHGLSFDELRRFCMIVERAHLPDLVALSRLSSGQRVDELIAPYLHALGLVRETGKDFGTFDGIGAETWYEMSELGEKFLKVSFSI